MLLGPGDTGAAVNVNFENFASFCGDVFGVILRDQVQQVKDYTTICPAAPSEALGIIALRNADTLVARSRLIVAEGKREVEGFFNRNADLFSYPIPDAGTFAFPSFQNEALSSREYCDELVEHAGIMLLPSALFEWGTAMHDDRDRRFRITFGRRSTPSSLRLWEGRCF